MDPWDTHLPLFMACVVRSSGPIVEFGAGYYSTLFCMNSAARGSLLTVETDHRWFVRFRHLHSAMNEFLLDDWNLNLFDWSRHWDVAFIDCVPAALPGEIVRRMANTVGFLVAHDVEHPTRYGCDFRNFRYSHISRRFAAWTIVASNAVPLTFLRW